MSIQRNTGNLVFSDLIIIQAIGRCHCPDNPLQYVISGAKGMDLYKFIFNLNVVSGSKDLNLCKFIFNLTLFFVKGSVHIYAYKNCISWK